MTTTTTGPDFRGWRRWLLVLVVAAAGPTGVGCGRGLLGLSSAQEHDAGLDPEAGHDPTSSSPPPGTSVCFSDHPASCDDTCRQATRILWTNCAVCHEAGIHSMGLPVFDFVMEPQKLTSTVWPRQTGAPLRFVIPGDPDHSVVYTRAVVLQDMPPVYQNIAVPDPPRVSAADGRILNDWITSCLGPDHGTGGATGTSETGGSYGFDAGNDAPGPVTGIFASCPSAAPSGACAINDQVCEYATQSCVCSGGTWACDSCPAAQPPVGTGCPIGDGGAEQFGGRNPSLSCLYGSVNCSCESGTSLGQWSCGVCPTSRPAEGGACGNSGFRCSFGDDTCRCIGNRWSCNTPTCPSVHQSQPSSCAGSAAACVFPALNQTCVCAGGDLSWACSCPVSLPVDGQSCVSFLSAACLYGERSCTCDGTWHCQDACPAAAPVAGAVCHSPLSCSYGSNLCYCAGDIWHC